MARERVKVDRSQEPWLEWAQRKLKKNGKFLIFVLVLCAIVISVTMCVMGGGTL
jgi:multisubunit Na+/H+ antiporter MnhC subunit